MYRPSSYKGDVIPGLTAITPVITADRITGSTPAYIQVSAAGTTMSATDATDAYRKLHFVWEFGDSQGVDNLRDPRTRQRIDPNRDQQGPEAVYVYREAGTFTITLWAFGWSGDNPEDLVIAKTTQVVTISAFNPTLGELFWDPVDGADVNDGLDGLGLSLSGATWTAATNTLTAAGKFVGVKFYPGMRIHLTGAGITAGKYVITSIASDGNSCTLATKPSATDQSGISSATGPKKTYAHLTTLEDPATDRAFWFKAGTTMLTNSTAELQIINETRFRWDVYGPSDENFTIKWANPGPIGEETPLLHLRQTGSNDMRDIVISRITFDNRDSPGHLGSPVAGCNLCVSGRDTTAGHFKYIYFDRCKFHTQLASARGDEIWKIDSFGNNIMRGFGWWFCTFDHRGQETALDMMFDGASYAFMVGCDCTSINNGNPFAKFRQVSNICVRWCSIVGTSDLGASLEIYPGAGASGAVTDSKCLIADSYFATASRFIRIKNLSENDGGLYDDVIVQNCEFGDPGAAGTPSGTIIRANSAKEVTVRDCEIRLTVSSVANAAVLFIGASATNTHLDFHFYGNKIFAASTYAGGIRLLNATAAGINSFRVLDNDWHDARTGGGVLRLGFTTHAAMIVDRNRYFTPNNANPFIDSDASDTAKSFASLQTAGFEANGSTGSNPNWNNPGGGDFTNSVTSSPPAPAANRFFPDDDTYRGGYLPNCTGIKPVITVSRLEGVEPFGVHVTARKSYVFNATEKKIAYSEVDWTWDFGDAGSGFTVTNPNTGVSENPNSTQRGGEAFFAYKTPGSFVITLTGKVWNGTDYITASTTIRVRCLPFTGTTQYYDPASGNDANPGTFLSPKQTYGNMETFLEGGSNRRALVKAGTTMVTDVGTHIIIDNQSTIRVNSYNATTGDPGARGETFTLQVSPTGPTQSAFRVRSNDSNDVTEDVVLSNCIIDCNNRAGSGFMIENLTSKGVVRDVCVLHCTITNTNDNHNFNCTAVSQTVTSAIAIYDCSIDATDSPNQGIFCQMREGTYLAIIAVTIVNGDGSAVLDHHIYAPFFDHGVFRWIDCQLSVSKNLCIRTGDPNQRWHAAHNWLMDGCDFTGTSNGIITGADDQVIQECRIHHLSYSGPGTPQGIAIASGVSGDGGGFLLNGDPPMVTVRRTDVYSCHLGDAPSIVGITRAEPNALAERVRMYRMRIYNPTTTPDNANKRLINISITGTSGIYARDLQIMDERSAARALDLDFVINHPSTGTQRLDMDYCDIYAPFDADPINDKNLGTARTFAQFQAAGFNPNGTTTDPNWNDPANGDFGQPAGAPTAEFSGTPLSGVAPLTVNFSDLSSGNITSWDWDFGDTGSSTDQNPSHQYTVPGTYTVTLTVTGPGGSDDEIKTDYITVAEPAPVAQFSGTPLSGDNPLTVNFSDLSSGNVTSWDWDFGDTGTSTDQNPSHQYTVPGTYTVTLTVTGPGGSDDEVKTNYITVNDPAAPPVADFSGVPQSGAAPLTVDFTDFSTGSITDWDWDFGDTGVSTEQNPTHQYTVPGTYTVTLTVTGPGGSDDEIKTDYITVTVSAPVADFSGTPLSGVAPLTVNFTDASTGQVTSWLWDFGDTGSSTDQNPTHQYTIPGTYSVRLTAMGPGGSNQLQKVGYVTVTAPIGIGHGRFVVIGIIRRITDDDEEILDILDGEIGRN